MNPRIFPIFTIATADLSTYLYRSYEERDRQHGTIRLHLVDQANYGNLTGDRRYGPGRTGLDVQTETLTGRRNNLNSERVNHGTSTVWRRHPRRQGVNRRPGSQPQSLRKLHPGKDDSSQSSVATAKRDPRDHPNACVNVE